MDDRLLAAEDWLLLGAAVFLALAFGGVEIWAYRPAAFLLVLAASTAIVKRSRRGEPLVSLGWWLLPAFLLAGWAAFQLVPLPPAVLGLLTPRAREIREAVAAETGAADPLAALERAALDRVPEAAAIAPSEDPSREETMPIASCGGAWSPISLEPNATSERLSWFVALLAGFLVVRERAADPERRRAYLTVLFALFGGLAAFGLLQDVTWNGKLYWVRPLYIEGMAFGPYVNANHFAGLMEIAVPSMAGYAWWRARSVGRAAVGDARVVLAAAGASLCLVAALAAASKMAALLIGCGVVVLVLSALRSARGRLVAGGVLVLVLAIGSLVLANSRLGERVDTYLARSPGVPWTGGRLAAWSSGLEMLGDFPFTGAGFGTFRNVFARYTPPGSHARWAQAHNDFLEAGLEGGIVTLVLVAWLAWGYARRVEVRADRRRSLCPLRLGVAIGVVSLAIHAMVDFNHQIPANAWIWVLTCGLAAPAVVQGAHEDEP